MDGKHETQPAAGSAADGGKGPLTFTYVTVSAKPAGLIDAPPAGTLRIEVSSHTAHEDPRSFTLTVNDRTEILSGGRPIALSDLEDGDGAVVVYRSVEGAAVALSIEVRGD